MFKKKMFQVYLLPRDIFAATNLKSGATEVRISESASPEKGTVPKLGDLTTDEYSFVIKCTASRHLPVRRKTPPPCRGGGSKSRRGFPPTCHSARGTRRPLWPPQGKQKGRYDPARRTKGHYGRRKANRRGVTSRGCETPSAPSGLVPLQGGTVHSGRL